MTTAVADRIDTATLERSRNVLLKLALTSQSASQSLHYALRVIATYNGPAQEADTRLKAARKLEGSITSYLLEQGTESAMVQYALAYQHIELADALVLEKSNIALKYFGRMRNAANARNRTSDVAISDLVNLQQPPERERDTTYISASALMLKENFKTLQGISEKANRSGWASQEEREGFMKLIRETDALRRAILPTLAYMSLEEPTAATKISADIGMKLEEFIQTYS